MDNTAHVDSILQLDEVCRPLQDRVVGQDQFLQCRYFDECLRQLCQVVVAQVQLHQVLHLHDFFRDFPEVVGAERQLAEPVEQRQVERKRRQSVLRKVEHLRRTTATEMNPDCFTFLFSV